MRETILSRVEASLIQSRMIEQGLVLDNHVDHPKRIHTEIVSKLIDDSEDNEALESGRYTLRMKDRPRATVES